MWLQLKKKIIKMFQWIPYFRLFYCPNYQVLWLATASVFSVAQGRFHAFYIHLCAGVYLSVFWWSVYLSSSLCTSTSSRHAYSLFTWMAISAALSITIIYIKFEINFTLFSPLCNYVNSCCKTKLHTWILIAVSFKSLWTLERKTQHYGKISVLSSQGFSVREGIRNWSLSIPCFRLTKLQNCPSIHLFIRLSTTEHWNLELYLSFFGCTAQNFKWQQELMGSVKVITSCHSPTEKYVLYYDLKWK